MVWLQSWRFMRRAIILSDASSPKREGYFGGETPEWGIASPTPPALMIENELARIEKRPEEVLVCLLFGRHAAHVHAVAQPGERIGTVVTAPHRLPARALEQPVAARHRGRGGIVVQDDGARGVQELSPLCDF